MKCSIGLSFALLCTLAVSSAQAQAPAVTYFNPSAVAPGAATNVTFVGANLANVTGVWSNIPGASFVLPAAGFEGNGTKPDNVVYQCTLPAETQVGIYGVRLYTGLGVSSVRLLMVDDLPSLNESGTNKTVEAAQVLTLPIAVDGACEAETFDYYKFTAAAGQRVSAEVVARRLGSPVDAVMRLLDATGRELAYSDDVGGIGSDCRFAHQFTAAGDYVIEIRDVQNRGSAAHRYRLRLGDFPLAVAPYPMGALSGSTPKLSVVGSDAGAIGAVSTSVGASAAPGARWPLGVKYPNGQGSAALDLVVSRLAEQVEMEPNDAPADGTLVMLPGAINGRLELSKDRDYYEFQGKAGTRMIFTGRTRSLGSPTDLFMRLLNADGGVLAEVEDTGVDEGLLDYTVPADGVFRLMVEDVNHHGGPDHVYRIEVDSYRPGFSLALEADKFDAPQGGVFVAKVTCVRRDYNGPITLSIAGAGDGFSLAANAIPEGAAELVISVTLPAGLTPGQVLNLRVVGKAMIGDAEFSAVASTMVPLRAAFSGLSNPPAALDGEVGLGVGPVFADFFQLAADPALYPQILGTSSFLVKATKLNGFDEAITLTVDGLPAGVTATVAPLEKGKPEVAIQLAGPGSLAEGDYAFRITGASAFQNQPKVVVASGVLRVVRPLEATVAMAGPLAPGGTQKIKVSVTRAPGVTGAISLALKNLPAGVTAPAEMTVADGQNEVEVDLTAAADARLGAATIVATASTRINNKPVAVESAPVTLQVATP